ncbi:hypothetical protein DPMN_128167 [Dreissena polymorpha]|uniref:Uncharacterized protein n=1 Tax=Dreissena polymorpha TaxID=45954 RepID=A0A9D4H3C8_DREPO|nr:hypothetical protein DPMN_128167 [Dreissena polymorpha]
MELKLKLKAGAIPTLYPETEAYKASKKAPLNPNDFGPGKHNRAKYGAYSKRNQKPATQPLRVIEVAVIDQTATLAYEVQIYFTPLIKFQLRYILTNTMVPLIARCTKQTSTETLQLTVTRLVPYPVKSDTGGVR